MAGPLKVQTHCRRGHEKTPANLYVHPTTGGRACRECMELTREIRRRKRHRAQPSHTGRCRSGRHKWGPENITVDKEGQSRCRPCARLAAQARYLRHHSRCIVARCQKISTNPDVESYICLTHRKNPPGWIFRAGLRIVGTEVLAA